MDVDTDSMVQQMIQRDFHGRTLLCIAHRRKPIMVVINSVVLILLVVNTIAFYDRVLVMDKGRLKEYDTPLNLFDQPGTFPVPLSGCILANKLLGSQFRAMCDKAGLSRADIVKIREGADAQLQDALASKQL